MTKVHTGKPNYTRKMIHVLYGYLAKAKETFICLKKQC